MWHAVAQQLASGSKYRLLDDETPLPFRKLIRLLENDDEFAAWHTRLLAARGEDRVRKYFVCAAVIEHGRPWCRMGACSP
ncbi:MAG: hypothetical protein WBM61_16885 [Woeseiaceae bacterium]|jgi:hypothetical protein